VLDIGPTTPLSADVWRAKMNVRPRQQRAPTTSHLRLRQLASESEDIDVDTGGRGDDNTAAVNDAAPEAVSCRDWCDVFVIQLSCFDTVKQY